MEVKEIIKESERRLNKLKVLLNFFNHSQLIAISVRTKVIHDIFASNKELDVNKLELFHLQYTDSLLEVLVKLKKNLEQKYVLIANEIEINKDMIAALENQVGQDDFSEKVKNHSSIIRNFLEQLYQQLAFSSSVNQPLFLDEKNSLSAQRGIEFYRKISRDDFEKMTSQLSNSVYEYGNFRIEKKLLGKINIQKFQFKFLCGLQFNNQFIEIYEFIHSNEHFVYFKEQFQFQSMQLKDFQTIDFSKNKSNKNQIITDLKTKNSELSQKASQNLRAIPQEVEEVLNDYYEKIAALEFLENLQNIDEQTNILRTMLNINIK